MAPRTILPQKPARARPRKHPYVTRKKGTCGGKPIIVGTRIKVSQIAIEHDTMGMSADQIVQAHPHLTLAQVHDALSYYFENIGTINEEIREGREFVEQLRKQYQGSLLEAKLAAKNLHR